MAAYPSLPIGLDSSQTPESRFSIDIDESGGFHSRSFHSAQYYRFSITHPGITAAQWNSLLTTYAGNPTGTYTLTFRNESPVVTYTVRFLDPPEISQNHGNNQYDVSVRLRGVKD